MKTAKKPDAPKTNEQIRQELIDRGSIRNIPSLAVETITCPQFETRAGMCLGSVTRLAGRSYPGLCHVCEKAYDRYCARYA